MCHTLIGFEILFTVYKKRCTTILIGQNSVSPFAILLLKKRIDNALNNHSTYQKLKTTAIKVRKKKKSKINVIRKTYKRDFWKAFVEKQNCVQKKYLEMILNYG